MKKFFFGFVIAVLGMTSVNAQDGLRIGAHAGIPTGDVADISSFQAGADLAYRFNIVPLLDLGPMVGYSRFFLESDMDQYDDPAYLPIAASGRLNFPFIFVGADLGYAVGLNDGNDGGFYYRPQVGVKLGLIALVGSYSGISRDGGTASAVHLGLEFGL